MPGLEKLLKGVLTYRQNIRPQMVKQFEKIRDNPEPKCVMFTCMDSRVIATRLLQSNVGDMFLVRNAGNLVPHAKLFSYETASTEPAALELGCVINGIRHVVVTGHSDCKAMNTLYAIRDQVKVSTGTPLQLWLKRHGSASVTKYEQLEQSKFEKPLIFQGETPKRQFEAYIDPENNFGAIDKFSQVSCLQQLQNIASYPFLRESLEQRKVRLHAFWFDIYTGDFYMFCRMEKKFVLITQDSYDDLIEDEERWDKEFTSHRTISK